MVNNCTKNVFMVGLCMKGFNFKFKSLYEKGAIQDFVIYAWTFFIVIQVIFVNQSFVVNIKPIPGIRLGWGSNMMW